MSRALSVCALLLISATTVRAQSARELQRRIQASQQELESIRQERDRLQGDLDRLHTRAFTIADELSNLTRQREATGRLVNELERQLVGLDQQVNQLTRDLILAQNALAEKQAISERRLIEIHKRGPLRDVQVLLAAESFGDLLSRYKYLFLVTRQDRQLTQQMRDLRNQIAGNRREIVSVQTRIGNGRDERAVELSRYRELQRQHARSLRETRRAEQSTESRLASLSAEEIRIGNLISTLENERRAAEVTSGTRRGTITDSDLGRLEWPVDGPIVYRFGPTQAAGGGRIRWDGIGIGSSAGAEVRAVRGGQIVTAEPLGTYRMTVIVDHGGGYYTLYAQMGDASVVRGQEVGAGQVLGHVGDAAGEQPRLHFELRGPGSLPLDPLTWLRRR